MNDEILRVENLTKNFITDKRIHEAVKNVSFAVNRGESVALVGGSGSGKTTTAYMILGFHEPDTGSMFYHGKKLIGGRKGRIQRKTMQMVFQNPRTSFSRHMSVFEGICEGINYFTDFSKEEKRRKVYQVMEKVKLPKSYGERRITEISGGECQRAAIARAIIIEPDLLVCDEITSALDVCVQAEIMDLLKNLRRESNMATLFISHDIALVNDFCNSVNVMHQGEIIESGRCSQVFGNPQHSYTRKLVDSVLTLEGFK